VDPAVLTAFYDELEKIGADESAPKKTFEFKPPVAPQQLKPKSINPRTRTGSGMGYTRSNVEAPGTDVSITMQQKTLPPPSARA